VQHANYNRAIEGELARTISQLDDVESSRVMIVAPENRLLNDASRKPTASVFVKVKGNGPLTPSAVNSIRLLVANSVEGLQANNVSVVDNQGNVLSENQEEDSPSGLSNSQLTARRNLEQYLTKKAEGMLDKVLGPGQAIVRVAADINWDTVTKTEEKYDPDGQVVKTSTINEENSDSATASPVAATPGVAANGNSDGQTNAPATPVNNTKTTKSIKTLGYELSKSTSSLIQAAGGIKRISSAVFIAQKFEGTGADRKAVPRAPEELQRIKHIVQSALGIMENDPARKDELTLEEIAFNEQPEIEMTQKFEKQEKREFWTGMGEKIIYPVLALGMIFMFWRTFKTTKFEEIPLGVPVGEPKGMSNGKSGSLAGYGRQRDGTPGVVTVDVLNQLIRENPSNVSSAVRTWLSTGKPNN
jgi:flagellar M-ring protein FliF